MCNFMQGIQADRLQRPAGRAAAKAVSKGEPMTVLSYPSPLLLTSASNACTLHIVPCVLDAAMYAKFVGQQH